MVLLSATIAIGFNLGLPRIIGQVRERLLIAVNVDEETDSVQVFTCLTDNELMEWHHADEKTQWTFIRALDMILDAP